MNINTPTATIMETPKATPEEEKQKFLQTLEYRIKSNKILRQNIDEPWQFIRKSLLQHPNILDTLYKLEKQKQYPDIFHHDNQNYFFYTDGLSVDIPSKSKRERVGAVIYHDIKHIQYDPLPTSYGICNDKRKIIQNATIRKIYELDFNEDPNVNQAQVLFSLNKNKVGNNNEENK